jgi:very-short-patch-repair endonuclease
VKAASGAGAQAPPLVRGPQRRTTNPDRQCRVCSHIPNKRAIRDPNRGRIDLGCRLCSHMPNKRAISRADRTIARLARRPHGIFTAADVAAAGVPRASIADRVRAGRLYRHYRGVYSVVPPKLLRIEGRWLAAVLACGPGAALSHTDAAALWAIRNIGSGPVHVTVPSTAGRRKRPGLAIHRSSTLSLPSQTTVEGHIPVTSPARTISDLRRMLPPSQFKSALHRAQKRDLDIGPQPEYLDDPDRSELERRLAALCRRHSLPLPRTQQVIGPYAVDFYWPEGRLVVETDGWEDHGPREAFESDRERDAWLVAHGHRVVRFTWRQLTREGPKVAETIRRALVRTPG